MMRILRWLVSLPLGIAAIALGVANRKPMDLVFNPFEPENPLFAIALPGYLVVLGTLALGVVLGGLVVWTSQGRHRAEARHLRETVRRLEADATRETAASPRLPSPRRAA